MKTNKTIQHKASFSPIADAGIQPGLRKKSRASGLPSFLSYQWSSRQFQSWCAASIGAFLEKRINQLITLPTWVTEHRSSARRKPSSSKMELAGQLWSFKKSRKLMTEAKEESQTSDSNPLSSCAGEPSRQQKHPERTSILSKGSLHAGGYQHRISVKILQKNGYRDRNRFIEYTVRHGNANRPHLIARGYLERTRTNSHTRLRAEDLRCESIFNGYQNPMRFKLLLNRYQIGTPANHPPLGSQDKTRLYKPPLSYQVKMQSHSPPGCLSIGKARHTHPLFSPSQSETTNSLNTIKS